MRVIAGRFGGRHLIAPAGRATRPTSDRVREALFAILADVTGAVVLDLYAGTGALGLEALSRGAERAVFVENARPALDALRRNVASLGLETEAAIMAMPVGRALRELPRQGPFDLVLADPPYAAVAEAAAALGALAHAGALRAGARAVLEHASRDAPPEVGGLHLDATRTYGDSAVTLFSCGVP